MPTRIEVETENLELESSSENQEEESSSSLSSSEDEDEVFSPLTVDDGGKIATEEEFDIFFQSILKSDEPTNLHVVFRKKGNGIDVEPYKEMILRKTLRNSIHEMHVLRNELSMIKFIIAKECESGRQHVLMVN